MYWDQTKFNSTGNYIKTLLSDKLLGIQFINFPEEAQLFLFQFGGRKSTSVYFFLGKKAEHIQIILYHENETEN